MNTLKKTRDWARSLVASEADTAKAPLQIGPASVRVYERLRRQLGAPVGSVGFQVLASRALALAKSESPHLSAVQVAANGGLLGLGEAEPQTHPAENEEAGILLIAQLLKLFLNLLGEATTLRLIEDLRLQTETAAAPGLTLEDTMDSASASLAIASAFECLLLEIDQLRQVSVRIENLASEHPGMEDGLISAAASIRSIATILDVFTLIRSKVGGSQEDAPSLRTNRYMN